MLDDKTEFKMSRLPPCGIRMGRFYDGKAVITCGWREVDPADCIKCGGWAKTKRNQKNESENEGGDFEEEG